jgi:hypothetical protein
VKSRLASRLIIANFVFAATFIFPIAEASTAAAHLHPISLSFPSRTTGFALSLYDCSTRTCAAMERTTNAGTSWTGVRLPVGLNRGLNIAPWKLFSAYFDSLSLNIHFANVQDGWIYGTVPAPATPTTTNPNYAVRLWSTHDGGASWKWIPLGPLKIDYGVIQMATHGAVTYLYGASFRTSSARILATSSHNDRWTDATSSALRVPAGGTQMQGSFTFSGTHGWFVGGNDRGDLSQEQLTASGIWTNWSVRSSAFNGSYAPVVAQSSHNLLVVATSALFVTPPAKSVPAGWNEGATWLFSSNDSGKSFKPVRQFSSSSKLGFPVVQGLPVVTHSGAILLERLNQGTSNARPQLVRTTDFGRSWRVVIGQGVIQVVFVSSTSGYAVIVAGSNPQDTSLVRTVNSGTVWTAAAL